MAFDYTQQAPKMQKPLHKDWRAVAIAVAVVGIGAVTTSVISQIQASPVRLSEVPDFASKKVCREWAEGKRHGDLSTSTLRASLAIASGEGPAKPEQIRAKCDGLDY